MASYSDSADCVIQVSPGNDVFGADSKCVPTNVMYTADSLEIKLDLEGPHSGMALTGLAGFICDLNEI